MAATHLPGTLPDPNYQPTYRSNGAGDDLAALVAPYSLSRVQLAEATGIADEATVNSWVEQCCPELAADAPAPPRHAARGARHALLFSGISSSGVCSA